MEQKIEVLQSPNVAWYSIQGFVISILDRSIFIWTNGPNMNYIHKNDIQHMSSFHTTSMSLVSNRFPRVRSRWIIPCVWRYRTPCTTWVMIRHAAEIMKSLSVPVSPCSIHDQPWQLQTQSKTILQCMTYRTLCCPFEWAWLQTDNAKFSTSTVLHLYIQILHLVVS